jgi:hypothetical protein
MTVKKAVKLNRHPAKDKEKIATAQIFQGSSLNNS